MLFVTSLVLFRRLSISATTNLKGRIPGFLPGSVEPEEVTPMALTTELLSSITLLSRIIDLLRECRPAKGTAPGRSQQPRPDRFQDLLQRQTRSFFLPQGKLSG